MSQPTNFNSMIDSIAIAAMQNATDTSAASRDRVVDDYLEDMALKRVEKKAVILDKCYTLSENIDKKDPHAKRFADISLSIAEELVKHKARKSASSSISTT